MSAKTIYLEPNDGSCRFYEVQIVGTKTIVTFGKIGNEGTKHEHDHATAAEAAEHAESLATKMTYKGFEKTTKRKRDDSEETPDGNRKSARVVALAKAAKKGTSPKKATSKKGKKETTKGTKSTTKVGAKRATKKESPEEASPKKASPKKAPKKAAAKKAPKKAEVKPPQKPAAQKSGIPVEWQVNGSGPMAYGIYVNDTHVYSGDEAGLVQKFDKTGALQQQYRLPSGVKCIVGDGIFLYVGTNDGSLYDITTGAPRLMSKIEAFGQVYWMDIRNGLIAASDNTGQVALVNAEGETIWVHNETGGSGGWMCVLDDTAVYHGLSTGVHKRELKKGDKVWSTTGVGSVMFGQQDKDHVYACCNGNAYKINKDDGKVDVTFSRGGPSMAVSKDSKTVVVSRPFTLFDSAGNIEHSFELNAAWDYANCPVSMAAYGENEFYGIRTNLMKWDFARESIAKAKAGGWETQSFSAKSIDEVLPETSVEVTSDASGGITCECVSEGGKLRVRVTSAGYNSSWNVQFPRAIREDGAKYVVEKIIDQGGFYRAWGDIKKLQS